MAYMKSAAEPAGEDGGCIFCDLPKVTQKGARKVDEDREVLILYRGKKVFVMLNKFPYNAGHLMVTPNRHVATFSDLDAAERIELMDTVAMAEGSLQEAFDPHGFNIGVNLGQVAGAGVLGHIHFHVVPRWNGDTNFMPVLGGTRVMGEYIHETYDRLLKNWRG